MPSGAAQTQQLHGGIWGTADLEPGKGTNFGERSTATARPHNLEICQAHSKCLASLGDSSAHQRTRDPASARFQPSWFVAHQRGLAWAGMRRPGSQARPTWRFPESGPLLCLSVLARGADSAFRGSQLPSDLSRPERPLARIAPAQMKSPVFIHMYLQRSMPNSRHPRTFLETRQRHLMAASARNP
jgi:hypothetical protein